MCTMPATFLISRRWQKLAILLHLGASTAVAASKSARSCVVARKEAGSILKNSGIVPMWQCMRLAKVRRQRHQHLAVLQSQLQVLAHHYGSSVVAKGLPGIHAARQGVCVISKANITASVYPVWRRRGPHPDKPQPQSRGNLHLHRLQDQEEVFALVQKTRHGTAVLDALPAVRITFAHKILGAATHTSLLVEALVQGVAGVTQDPAILASTLSLNRMDGKLQLTQHRQKVKTHTVRLPTCSYATESNTANAGRKTWSASPSRSKQKA